MKITTLSSIEEVCAYYKIKNIGHIFDEETFIERSVCDKNNRKVRDAEIITRLASNITGDALEIGTSHGHGTYKISSNIKNGNSVYTINYTPEKYDKIYENNTHILEKNDIGSYYRKNNAKNVIQIYADSMNWNPPIHIRNLGMVFIDGAHDRDVVKNDSQLAYNLLDDEGFIIWHDFNPELRNKFSWINSVMNGIEDFLIQYGIEDEIVHLKNSWTGILRKKKNVNCLHFKSTKVGLVLDKKFHFQKKWVTALTAPMIDAIISSFDTYIISNQKEYEFIVEDIDALISMEPRWGAPEIEFLPNKLIQKKFLSIPTYVYMSDPHKNKWKYEYSLKHKFKKILSPYYTPLIKNIPSIDKNTILHFPWAVPDEYLFKGAILPRENTQICCFGGKDGEAYETRNWCRNFEFVHSAYNSGCENKIMTELDYSRWLLKFNAFIAAGSASEKYMLTTPKYFEILAAGALLFAQHTEDLERLGFIHNQNCIIFNEKNFEQESKKYLRNPNSENYLEIRRNGLKLINERHLTKYRMKMLHEDMQKIKLRPHHSSSSVEKRFHYWFSKICIDSIKNKSNSEELLFDGIDLPMEIKHEVFAFNAFDPSWAIERIISTSKNRYELLEQIWPGENPSETEVTDFYLKSADILPWGHGVFGPDHDTEKHRKNWLRRIDMLAQLKSMGAKTVADYSAGGGHTTLAALAMQFEQVGHIEFDIFHPFVRWRLEKIPTLAQSRMVFADPRSVEKLDVKFDAVICSDVPEHVYDYNKLLRHLQMLLKPQGLLLWVSFFGEGISCHLHPELKGREEALLKRYGFHKEADCAAEYTGYSGVFRFTPVPRKSTASKEASPLFQNPHEVYIASADRIDKVVTNNCNITKNYPQGAYAYATVIGGLSGLNYLQSIKPEKIFFFDVNEKAVVYCRLILEMISICESHNEFISRIFCRDVDRFISENNSLTHDNQYEYLRQEVDTQIFEDTLNRLTAESTSLYKQFITPYHPGKILAETRNCRHLLPCWPENHTVPVGAGQPCGRNSAGELVPNVNTFFYGQGWLESRESFLRTRSVLEHATIICSARDILTHGIADFFEPNHALVLHISNIDDWFPEKFSQAAINWIHQAQKNKSDLLLITSHNGVLHMHADAHCLAYEALRTRISGSIVEVTTKPNWGFHEFEKTTIIADEYIKNPVAGKNTILHILVGEGLPVGVLQQALRTAMEQSEQIFILEHNKSSQDWLDSTTPMLTAQELLDLTNHTIYGKNFSIKEALLLPGQNDAMRNVLLVVQKNK